MRAWLLQLLNRPRTRIRKPVTPSNKDIRNILILDAQLLRAQMGLDDIRKAQAHTRWYTQTNDTPPAYLLKRINSFQLNIISHRGASRD